MEMTMDILKREDHSGEAWNEGTASQALLKELEKGVKSVKNGEVYTIEEAWKVVDSI